MADTAAAAVDTGAGGGGARALIQAQPRWLIWAAIIVVAILVIAVVVMGVGWNTALAERAAPMTCVLSPGWDLSQSDGQLHQEVADGEFSSKMAEVLRAGMANPKAVTAVRSHRNTATGMYVTQIAMSERPVVSKASAAAAAAGASGGLSLKSVLDKHQSAARRPSPKVRFEDEHAPPAPGTLAARSMQSSSHMEDDEEDDDEDGGGGYEPPDAPMRQQHARVTGGAAAGRLGGANKLPAIGSLPGAGGRKAPAGRMGGGGMTLSGVSIEMHRDPT